MDSEGGSNLKNERVRCIDVNDSHFSDSLEEQDGSQSVEERKEPSKHQSLLYNHSSYELESSQQRNSIFDEGEEAFEEDLSDGDADVQIDSREVIGGKPAQSCKKIESLSSSDSVDVESV